jgi:hypothetical protein
MEQSRHATLAFLSRLPDEALVRPRTQGQWSIKDVLTHIAAWEEEGTRRLELIARGRGHGIHFYNDPHEIDRFNARVIAASRRTQLHVLLRRLARTRDRLTGALTRLPRRALRDPSHEYAVVEWLPEFAWTHEQAHLREIMIWWRKERSAAKAARAVRLRRRRPRGRASRRRSDPRPRGSRDP